jgi:glycosyltransferase involved in cell wall biosynthesis
MRDVLFIVRGARDDAASSRYRVYQYLDPLRRNGVSWRVVKPPRRKIVQWYLWLPWIAKVLLSGISSRCIFVQKDIFSIGLWRFFKKMGKRIVYDFDDAVFIDNAPGGNAVYAFPFTAKQGRELVAEMLRLSDLATVANGYLEGFARIHAGKTLILPMSLDLSEFPVKEHGESDEVVLGWIGSPQTSPFLSLVRDALECVASRYQGKSSLKIVTNGRVDLPGIGFQHLPWDGKSEIGSILSFDIGIVPLPEDPFTLGKSSFKLLQYMACGVPPVCSAVGFNREAVIDGENGFLAGDTDEWARKLGRLIEDGDLRKRMGKAARATVEKKFSLDKNALSLAGALKGSI